LDKALYDDYLCLVASNKQQIQETTGKVGNGQLLSECGFVQIIVPPSLSRDRRIRMEQNKTKNVDPNWINGTLGLNICRMVKKTEVKVQ